MNKDIAIIGLSMKVADVENLEEFWNFIVGGEPGFNALSSIRQNDIFNRFGEFEIACGSYLDRVDLFDNEFFMISQGEAERMDPEQRLMLEGAVKAVNNAGYLTNDLKGQRIGIFYTFEHSQYKSFFDDKSNLSITSHMPGMRGTRVANFMDWRGPVVGIDTTCSSSLSAMYYACQSLTNGDCSMALVGGVSLGVSPKGSVNNSPIISKNGKCLPFDKDADGTLAGEGAFCVLLKNVEDAIRDNDPVHAVIKGMAINHGGALIQNISAPSPIAQSEVIRMAWQKSEIDPNHIRFIEAHGTGTVLGDPIEFKGIVDAFYGTVGKLGKKVCSISSAKGQIGHLGSLAGLAGLARLILALKNKRLLPQVGFSKINELITENESPISIQKEMEYWDSDRPRLGGISSFGLTGTNVHIILEEFSDPKESVAPHNDNATHLLMVGGATLSKAIKIREYLQEYLSLHSDVNLTQFCYSVNKMIGASQYCQSILFNNKKELVFKLAKLSLEKPRQIGNTHQVILLVPGILAIESMSSFLAKSHALSEDFRLQLESILNVKASVTDKQKALILHYCAAKMLSDTMLTPRKIIGAQSGKLISLLLSGEITIEEALIKVISKSSDEETFDRNGFIKFLDSLDSSTKYVFVVMGRSGEINTVLKQWTIKSNRENIKIISPNDEHDVCLQIIASYFNEGNEINHKKLFTKEKFIHDLYLPMLEPKRFWPEVNPIFTSQMGPKEDLKKGGEDSMQQHLTIEKILAGVQAIWIDVLKLKEVGNSDDFFGIGGSSLLGLDVLQLIENKFGVNLEYPDIFDHPTIASLGELILEKLKEVDKMGVQPEQGKVEVVKEAIDVGQRQRDYEKLLGQIKEQQSLARVSPVHILVTGATGFLGAYVVRDLLTRTTAKISCLVRSETNELARGRVVATLKSYFPNESMDFSRIHAVKGDIVKPNLGLDPSIAGDLNQVDMIYHLAANVNHYGKIELTNKVNFEGTVNLLEWSKATGVTHFNYFSSTAVAWGYINNIKAISFYENDLDLGQNFGRHLYSASKFKAEKYIKENKGNLSVNIFRIGNIGGDSKTGVFQKNIESNNFYQRLQALATLGCYCDELSNHLFETTPVDIVSQIVMTLSLQRNEILNTFHIVESDPFHLDEMAIQLASQQIKVERIGADEFKNHVNKLSSDPAFSSEHPMLAIMRYGINDEARTQFTIAQDATRAYLNKSGVNQTYDKKQYARMLIKYCLDKEFIKITVE